MSSTLYSLRTDGDQFRITKITDGDIESSYLCTETECECPAGHRPSCRHRQMLPQMLAHGLCNTHWFWNFDSNRVVDFNGELKSNLDALNELAAVQHQAKGSAGATFGGWEPLVGEAQHTELCVDEGCPQSAIEHVCITTTKPAWRRL